MRVVIAQVFVGSNGAAASYMDTGQPIRVNKTAWKVTIVDDYGCEEAFYFRSEKFTTNSLSSPSKLETR